MTFHSGIELLTLTLLLKGAPPFILRTGSKTSQIGMKGKGKAPLLSASYVQVLSSAEMPEIHLMLNASVFYLEEKTLNSSWSLMVVTAAELTSCYAHSNSKLHNRPKRSRRKQKSHKRV